MADYQDVVKTLAALTGASFRPASADALAALRKLELPQSVLDFYAEHEPDGYAEGQVRMWGIAEVLVEIEQMVPGCYVAPHGYVVMGSTLCGDAYCYDLNRRDAEGNPRIVLFSHEIFYEETTAADAARLAKPIARNLREFLEQFARGEVDEECIY